MRIFYPLLCLLLLLPFKGQSQTRSIFFQLSHSVAAATPVESLYGALEVLDLRPDTGNMGTVQTGFLQGGRITPVVTKVPLTIQVPAFYKSLILPAVTGQSLLLSLRHFSFQEQASPYVNVGNARLQAALFVEGPAGSYRLLGQIDSTLERTYKGEGTEALLSAGAGLLASFLVETVSRSPAGEALYTRADLLRTDSLLKTRLPLFEREILAEGLYLTWNSFALQRPDYQIKAQAGNGIVMNVKTVGEEKNRRFGHEEMYALVHKGIPYIATEFGYCKLHKTGSDWVFTGRAREVASQGALLVGGLAGGLTGAALAAGTATGTYEMKLDPADGRFIKLREVKSRR